MNCPNCNQYFELEMVCGVTIEEIERLKQFKLVHRYEKSKSKKGGKNGK